MQSDAVQRALIQDRGTRAETRTRNLLLASTLMFLFGGISALWANKSHRNPMVWFFAGFVFNVFALLEILWLISRNGRRKRYRRTMAYWSY